MSKLTPLLEEKVSRISEKVDNISHDTGGGLHAAASSIRRRSDAVANLAEIAATKLDHAGSYIEKHDSKWMTGESRQILRRYRTKSLLIAVGVGLLAGFAIRRSTHSCDNSAPRV
jgi:hypothetical protein